jgi:pimeloyl-ACP methyl ester carboxylesterase
LQVRVLPSAQVIIAGQTGRRAPEWPPSSSPSGSSVRTESAWSAPAASDSRSPTASRSSADLLTIDADNGVAFTYRRFGNASAAVPLVFLQHFRGNVDSWDPALVEGVAAHREVILFDNASVAGSTGATPETVEQMALDAMAFLDALSLAQVDLFGFSLGGFVAQEIALTRPERVRRLILAGTGPKGAPGMEGWSPELGAPGLADGPAAHQHRPADPGAPG